MQIKFGKKFNAILMDTKRLTEKDFDRIIEMAWEDRTPFEAILFQFGLSETLVIKVKRANLKDKVLNVDDNVLIVGRAKSLNLPGRNFQNSNYL